MNINTSIAEQLNRLEETKEQLKQALAEKGQPIDNNVPFRNYVDNVNNLGAAHLYNNLDELNISNISNGSIGVVYDINNADFQGIFVYNKDKFEVAPTQLQATDADVMGIPYFGKNGVSIGTFNTPKYFTDANISDLTAYEKTFDSFYDTLDTTNISNWHSFYYKTKIKHQKPRYINIQNATNVMWAFENAYNIFEFPTSNNWDLSKVTDTSGMFVNCYNLREMVTTGWNLCSTNRARTMFCRCTNLNLNAYSMGQWNCINLTDAYSMFAYSNVSQASLNNWASLNNSQEMFRSCPNLKAVWFPNGCQTTNSVWMFSNCVNLGSDPSYGMNSLNNVSFPRVLNAMNMFENCVSANFNFIDWNFINLTQANHMFYNCQNIKGVNKQFLNFEKSMPSLKNAIYMFYNCKGLNTLTHTSYNLTIPNLLYSTSMFENCTNLSTFLCGSTSVQFVMPNLSQAQNMFTNCINFSPNISWNMPNLRTAGIVHTSGITNITMKNTDNLASLTSFITTTNCNRLHTVNVNGTAFTNLQNIQIGSAPNLQNILFNNISVQNGIKGLSFTNLPNLVNLSINNIPYNSLVSLTNFLRSCPLITNINLSEWNIPAVNSLSNAFVSCSNLQSIDLSNVDLSNVTSLTNAFRALPNLTELNLNNTNLQNVTYMDNSFSYLTKLTNLDISSLDGDKIRSTYQAFFECHNLQTINLPYFSNLTYGNNTFANCYNLDINCVYGKFDMNNIFTIEDMFYRNFNIYNLDMKKLMGETCTRANMSFMFRTCTNLRNISFANMNLPNLDSLHYTFYWAGPLEEVDFTNCNLDKLGSMTYTFAFSSMVDCTFKNLNVPNLASMTQTFWNCHSLQNITFENFNAPKLSNVTNCFGNRLSSLKRISFVNANLCNLKTPALMFVNCGQISHLNYQGANLANATTLLPDSGWYCSSNLHYLDYSNAYTPNITTLGICYRTSSGSRYLSMLTDYNAANIDTTKVTSLVNTFYAASNLVNIDFTNCTFPNVTNVAWMLGQCNKLSDASIDHAINIFLSCVNCTYKNLSVSNTYSPFYRSNITSTKYANRLAELDAAGWTY